ncbi:MAG: MFS transporter [Myxococcota bacterium]
MADRRAVAAVVFGFMLTASSSVGQTFFISLFSGEIRAELALSHGAFGIAYTVATLGGGLSLLVLGAFADRIAPGRLAAVTLVGLGLAALAFSSSYGWWTLVFALFGLRLLGQGMLSHISVTSVGRWFERGRGKALGLSSLGHAAGQAVLPGLVAFLLVGLGWRQVWLGIAAFLVVVLVPAALALGRRTPDFVPLVEKQSTRSGSRRSDVLRDSRFYILLPGILAPPFIVTGVFFHQVHLAELKGWGLTTFALTYPLFATAATLVGLGTGFLVDRFGALRLVPVYLLPLAVGLLILSVGDAVATASAFMIVVGSSSGASNVVLGALWPELYGTAHLGAIRAMVMTLMVIATAASPGLSGVLIDVGIELPVQLTIFSVYTLISALVLALMIPRMRRR